MSTTAQMWVWAVLLPALTFLTQNMCVWRAPRFLGVAALLLLSVSLSTLLFFLAAIPASVYFGTTSLLYRKKDGELVRRTSMAASCLCFMGLWILAIGSANSLRHRAFVQASRVGDRLVQTLAQYRSDTGEYPDSLNRLIPSYLKESPYTGMIAYPEFSYRKDRNDIQTTPGSYELRIDCTSGGINFDRFIYWPSETYPDRIQGNGVERIHKWAYVHE
ncbi:MAG: hypothetical protein ACLQIB_28070 [Isosphaeraceae bacterium]